MPQRASAFYVLVALGAVAVGLAVAENYWRASGQAEVGAPAPEVAAFGPDGREWRLSELRGQVVLLDFWARWCDPCVRMMPTLDRLAARLAARGFRLFSINIEPAPADEIRAWLAQRGHHLAFAQDRFDRARAAFGVSRIPMLVLVGPEGVVRRVYQEPPGEGTLEADIEALLPAKVPGQSLP
jgi:thiol-disulfide isomerase/thioredoxin